MYKIVCLIIVFSSGCFGQNELLDILPLSDGRVNYSNVLEVNEISQVELHGRARNWLLSTDYIQNEISYSDDKYKQIDSKSFFKELWGPNYFSELYTEIYYTVNFKFRNGRYKYEITNFIIKKNGTETQLEIFKMERKKNMKYNKLFYEKIDSEIKKIITSIENSMTISPVVQRIE